MISKNNSASELKQAEGSEGKSGKIEEEFTVARLYVSKMKSEVKNLGAKVRNLECVLEEMHKAAENRREIERQHKEALEKLKQKQVVEVPLLIVEEENIFFLWL